jgi:hypothetical protein
MCPKWHPLPYEVYFFGPWSKVVHYYREMGGIIDTTLILHSAGKVLLYASCHGNAVREKGDSFGWCTQLRSLLPVWWATQRVKQTRSYLQFFMSLGLHMAGSKWLPLVCCTFQQLKYTHLFYKFKGVGGTTQCGTPCCIFNSCFLEFHMGCVPNYALFPIHWRYTTLNTSFHDLQWPGESYDPLLNQCRWRGDGLKTFNLWDINYLCMSFRGWMVKTKALHAFWMAYGSRCQAQRFEFPVCIKDGPPPKGHQANLTTETF